jgi:circadian clock protein KaiB
VTGSLSLAHLMQRTGPLKVAGESRHVALRRLSLRALNAGGGDLSKYLLRLFVTGASSRTSTAIANLKRICDQELQGQYELEIIDVLEFPEKAETERILATPTLIKSLPLPLRRVIGDLSDKEKVLLGLEVQPKKLNPVEGEASRDE